MYLLASAVEAVLARDELPIDDQAVKNKNQTAPPTRKLHQSGCHTGRSGCEPISQAPSVWSMDSASDGR
jgi:hypothetical protein